MLANEADGALAPPAIVYSRGRSVRDVEPQQLEVRNFDALIDTLDADRALTKANAPYFCAAMEGDGRRCMANVLPRSWLAFDLDRVDAQRAQQVLDWFSARGTGAHWHTHSSSPQAPRLRVVMQLTRAATRQECMDIGARMTALLLTELGDGVIDVDDATFRGEQPIYLPPQGATITRFGTGAVDPGSLIAPTPLQKSTEAHEGHSSVPLCVPLCSSVDEPVELAIAATCPKQAGQRQRCLFAFARRLKALRPDATPLQRRQVVQAWHQRALPYIRSKDLGETLDDFERGWAAVRLPHGETLALATTAAATFPVPARITELGYGSTTMLLVRLCGSLAALSGSGLFFISCRIAAQELKVDHTLAAKLLRTLVRDEVLELVSKGAGHQASRYRWALGDGAGRVLNRQAVDAGGTA